MPTIEVSESVKEYLDAWRNEPGDNHESLTYSQAIMRLQERSWQAAHGGGKPEKEHDEMALTDEDDRSSVVLSAKQTE